MTNKKILSIDIDDEKFKAFYEQWKEFNVDLEDMPAEWKELGESVAQSHEALAAAAGVLLENMNHASLHAKDLVDHLKEAAASQKDFKSATADSEITLKKMGKEAKEFADSIFNVGKFLMKLDVIGGVTGIGSLWGIDKLANGAIETQRQALGLGLTTGQLKAFQTDFGERYIDEGTLGSIADARNDLTKQWAIRKTTGLSQSQIDQTDVGTLAAKMAISAHDWWASTPDSEHNIQFAKAKGFLDAGNSFDQVRQWGNTDRGELNRALMQYHQDASQLNIGSGNTDVLYDFKRQLTLAGQILETDFSDKLADLNRSGALSGFIHALSDDAKVLVDDVLKPENLNKIKDALSETASFLGSADFKKDLEAGAGAVKEFADTTTSVVAFLKKEFPGASDLQTAKDLLNDPLGGSHKDPKDKNSVDHALDFLHQSKQDYDHAVHHAVQMAYASIMNSGDVAEQHSVGAKLLGDIANDTSDGQTASASGSKNIVNRKQADALFARLEKAKGLPPGILDALALNESNFDASAVSMKHAQGLFQLMPAVSRALGLTDPLDWRQNAMGAAELLSQLKGRYKGDLKKEIAAWNWNPSALDKDIAANGSDWSKNSPQETQELFKRVMKTLNANRTANVNITITNKAGTDVAVQTNAGSF